MFVYGSDAPFSDGADRCLMRLKGDDIAERLLAFAAGTVSAATQLRSGPAATHFKRQLIRAGTAGGASYEEARCSESRQDFAHKVLIAAKELREAVYWVRLCARMGLGGGPLLAPLVDEGNQLAAILSASARTARANDRAGSS